MADKNKYNKSGDEKEDKTSTWFHLRANNRDLINRSSNKEQCGSNQEEESRILSISKTLDSTCLGRTKGRKEAMGNDYLL